MKLQYLNERYRNINVTSENCLETRSFYCGFKSYDSALRMDQTKSENYKSLNGEWDFKYFDSPLRIDEEMLRENDDHIDYESMMVPGIWQLNGYDKPIYNDCFALFPIADDGSVPANTPTGLYKKEINVNLEENKEYILRLDGVESAYDVYLNGSYVGYATGPRNTHEFDLTEFMLDGVNVIKIIVYKFSSGSYLENQDMWWFAGITRDVSLIERSTNHLVTYKIETVGNIELDQNVIRKEHDFNLNIKAFFKNDGITNVDLALIDAEGNKIFESTFENIGMELDENIVIENAKVWSAEQPYLYKLIMTLKNNGEVVEYYSDYVGFREIVKANGLVYINGVPLKFKGVNRHDWNENTGRVITKEDMLKDLQLMKDLNVNAIRTAHYPPSPLFLTLCDQMGFYVMEEADIECNQMEHTDYYCKLADDTRWENHFVDRVKRMVLRDYNHPSVVSWSLGNESGFGSNFVVCGRTVKNIDDTRFIHYEEDANASITDVYSTMYTRQYQLDNLGKDILKDKPHIVCEYAHAMGNGPGGLNEYWEIFKKYKRLQGGFIWEWVDHGIKQVDENGNKYYAYGGDFDDHPNSGAFCCDGLIQADRTPTPATRQVKKVFENVVISDFNHEDGTILIENDYDFIDLNHLEMAVTINENETTIMELPLLEPHTSKRMLIVEDGVDVKNLDIRILYKNPKEYMEKEHTFFQIINELPLIDMDVEKEMKNELDVKTTNSYVIIGNKNFQVTFDLIEGNLSEYELCGKTVVKGSTGWNFYRALVDNDINIGKVWRKSMMQHMCTTVHDVEINENDNCVKVVIDKVVAPFNINWKVVIKEEYKIYNDGVIDVKTHGIPSGKQLPESVARIGIGYKLDQAFESIEWYGRGINETYKDCKLGNPFGTYVKSVSDNYFHYVVPQETGNHEDTAYVLFSSNDAIFKVESDRLFSFSALHYTMEDLDKCKHPNELTFDKDVNLELDYATHGLGSASWGAECTEKDKLHLDPYNFNFRINVKLK